MDTAKTSSEQLNDIHNQSIGRLMYCTLRITNTNKTMFECPWYVLCIQYSTPHSISFHPLLSWTGHTRSTDTSVWSVGLLSITWILHFHCRTLQQAGLQYSTFSQKGHSTQPTHTHTVDSTVSWMDKNTLTVWYRHSIGFVI